MSINGKAHKEKEGVILRPNLLDSWQGMYGGVPYFAGIKNECFVPAIKEGIKQKRAEIESIISTKEKVTFENTIQAFENAGAPLRRAKSYYSLWCLNVHPEGFDPVEEEVDILLGAFDDWVYQNSQLYNRVKAVSFENLNDEQKRLVEKYKKEFESNGVDLSDEDKVTFKQINEDLSKLQTKFSQNVKAAEESFFTIDSETALIGLPKPLVGSMKREAESRKLDDKWVVLNTRSAVEPVLKFSENPKLRKDVWEMFANRCNLGDENDNNEIIPQILELRAKRMKLIGAKSYAHWSLKDMMAKTPEAALSFMENVWNKSKSAVEAETAEIREEILCDDVIEPWDYLNLCHCLKVLKYKISEDEVMEYFQYEKMKEAMFDLAKELFQVDFQKYNTMLTSDTWHKDVEIWEVKKDGEMVGLMYLDPYARKGKSSGAWMDEIRTQQKGVYPIVSCNSNFLKGEEGKPTLISLDDTNTLFHEFGHCLHGLLSSTNYRSLSGTNVVNDYVEFPSQFMERFMLTDCVLSKYALHYVTKEPMPADMVATIKRTQTIGTADFLMSYLMCAIPDLLMHMENDFVDHKDGMKRFEIAYKPFRSVTMRHRLHHFSHVFECEHYASAYYCYLWSEVLSADAFDIINEAREKTLEKDITLDERAMLFKQYRDLTVKLHDFVFSVGNSIDPEIGYKKFAGRDPNPMPLLKEKGLK